MRREMAAAIDLGDDHQRLSHAVRELGPYLATVYVLAILLVGIVEIVQAGGLTPGAVTGSLLLVVVAPLADMALCRILTPRSTGKRRGRPRASGAAIPTAPSCAAWSTSWSPSAR